MSNPNQYLYCANCGEILNEEGNCDFCGEQNENEIDERNN